jgi:hypothetical protein
LEDGGQVGVALEAHWKRRGRIVARLGFFLAKSLRTFAFWLSLSWFESRRGSLKKRHVAISGLIACNKDATVFGEFNSYGKNPSLSAGTVAPLVAAGEASEPGRSVRAERARIAIVRGTTLP